VIRSRARAASSEVLQYHGGSVMHSNRVHAIFWFPPGYTLPPAYRSVIDQYFSDVAAASGGTTNVYSSDPQYTDSTAAAAYSSSVAPDIVDTNAFPTRQGCADSATSVCYSDGQITAEIDRLIANAPGGPLPRGSHELYFLFTPPNVGSCYDSQSCAFTQFCAYHSDFGQGSGDTLYANMPYGASASQGGCGPTESLNGNAAADLEVSLISHEHNEAITDPFGTGWYAADGQENGDECAYNYGALQGGGLGSGGAFNQVIGADHYLLQQEWSNSAGGCVQSAGPAPTVAAPTAALNAPATVPVGTASTFSASASTSAPGHSLSYAWSFGDGATADGASVAHAYTGPGPHTVTLTVTQDDAQTASASQTVTAVAPPPVAAFVVSQSPTTGDPVLFDGSPSADPYATIPDGGYSWDFGDGSTAVGPAPSHVYAAPGVHVVTLTVTDADGSRSVQQQVVVAPSPPAARPATTNSSPAKPGTTNSSPAKPGNTRSTPTPTALSVHVPTQRLASVLRHGLSLTLTSPDLSTARVQAAVDGASVRRLHLNPHLVVSAQARLTGGRATTLTLRIDQALRSELRRLHHVRLTLRVTVTRPDGTTASAEQQVDLRG
jgi:PKD repeat protein